MVGRNKGMPKNTDTGAKITDKGKGAPGWAGLAAQHLGNAGRDAFNLHADAQHNILE